MTAQVPHVGWTLGHLDDLDADFLRYFGRDWSTLDGPRFFSLAARVGVYGGVISYRIMEVEAEEAADVVPLAELAGDDLIEVG